MFNCLGSNIQFVILTQFLYCGKADLSDFNYQEIMDVVALADEYKIGDVIAKSSEDLVKLVNVKNAVAVLEFLSSLNCKSSSDCVQYDASFSKCFNFIIRLAQLKFNCYCW